MVARKKQAARAKTARKKATSRKSASDRAWAAFDDSLQQLEKRLPKNLVGVAHDLRRNLKDFQRQIDKARKEREDRWNRIESQLRRDAARMLRRLEKAVEPEARTAARKKTARKKTTPRKNAPRKATDV
jgi:hypothetical protein